MSENKRGAAFVKGQMQVFQAIKLLLPQLKFIILVPGLLAIFLSHKCKFSSRLIIFRSDPSKIGEISFSGFSEILLFNAKSHSSKNVPNETTKIIPDFQEFWGISYLSPWCAQQCQLRSLSGNANLVKMAVQRLIPPIYVF